MIQRLFLKPPHQAPSIQAQEQRAKSNRPPLQPAPGRSTSGTPTSHTFPTGPLGHPVMTTMPSAHDHAHPHPHYNYPEPGFTNSPQTANSAFSSHAYFPTTTSPGYGSASPRPTMFNDASFGRIDPNLGDAMQDSFASSSVVEGPGPVKGDDPMFNELTNQGEGEEVAVVAGEAGKKMREGEGSVREQGEEQARWEGADEMDMFFDAP